RLAGVVAIGQLAKARAGAPCRPLLPMAAPGLFAVLVDGDGRGIDADCVGALVEHLHAALEKRGRADVVVRRPAEELAAGVLEGEVGVVDPPDVARIAEVADARIARGILLADARRRI